jgi:ribosomal protein S18 acetylase RimI-like enzyme
VILHNLAPLGVPVLLKNLSLRRMKKVFETLFYAKIETETGTTLPEVSAELLSIAVSVDARGLGVGKRLIAMLDEFFISKSLLGDYRVVTAAEDKRSNAFYRNAGFRFYRTFQHHDVPMNEYRKRPASVHRQASTRSK